MPIINFTTADVLRSKLLEPGYYSFRIADVVGPKENNNKDGFNFIYKFELIDKGEGMDGKIIDHSYSNKAMSMMLPCIAAIRGGGPIDPKDFTFNTDEVLNGKVDCQVIQDTYNGQLNNKIIAWFPYKSVVGKAAAF